MNGVTTTGTILDQIIADKTRRIAEHQAIISIDELSRKASARCDKPQNLAKSLRSDKSLSLIGEIKKASPSRGIIQSNFDPVGQARAYQAAGVSAISVLTEEDYFQGSDKYLQAVASTVALPLLRKDFIIDPYQIFEARILGASAVLLICAALQTDKLRELLSLTHDLGMQALVEVHDLSELMIALDSGAVIIGINNRDLHTFHVDLAVTERLAGIIPAGRTIVSESGIKDAQDMARIYRAGAHAVLIGEALMRAFGPATGVYDTITQLYSQLPG